VIDNAAVQCPNTVLSPLTLYHEGQQNQVTRVRERENKRCCVQSWDVQFYGRRSL
jgi:hypothetical protein